MGKSLFVRLTLESGNAIFLQKLDIKKIICGPTCSHVTYTDSYGKETGIVVKERDTWFLDNL